MHSCFKAEMIIQKKEKLTDTGLFFDFFGTWIESVFRINLDSF